MYFRTMNYYRIVIYIFQCDASPQMFLTFACAFCYSNVFYHFYNTSLNYLPFRVVKSH